MNRYLRIDPVDSELTQRIAKGRSVIAAQTDLLHRSFGRTESRWKHDGTRVTPVDLEISQRVSDSLTGDFPNDQILSEESDQGPVDLEARFGWILDPVDGTNNYAFGVPMVAISLALLENGEPVYGFIYDLGARCLIHGGPGLGLWVDDEPTKRRNLEGAKERVVAMHSPVDTRRMPVVRAVLEGCKIRALGSGTLHLTYVALGRIDACLDFTIKIWDIAAAVALCRESGVDILFLEANPFPVRKFDVRMKPTPYLAAQAEILEELKGRIPVD
jgi:myo-inositol-1(or 4)-monophosphatase